MTGHAIGRWSTRRTTCAIALQGILLAISTAHLLGAQQSPVPVPALKPLAFKGVTVIDVTDGRLIPEQTVVITGNRLQAVGPSGDVKVPKDAEVIDARNQFVIPGLWDMHTHTEQTGADVATQVHSYRRAFPQYIASGVTGIREMAQRFTGVDSFRLWRNQVMTGERIGPRAVGPSADLTHKIKFTTDSEAIRIIDSLENAGDAFVKYHDSRTGNREHFFALLRESRKLDFPMVGHIPPTATTVEALDSGMRSIEHVNEIRECPYTVVPMYDSLDAETNCAPLAQAFVRNGTWLTPTLAIFYYFSSSENDVMGSQAFVGLLHRMGVRRFLAGTDCDPMFLKNLSVNKVCHRGFSLLQEVIALRESGLTALEALQAATIGPAQFFEATDSLGTVEKGKLADLVFLDANPLTNIRNVLKIRAVVANGRYYDRATLDAIDPRAVKLAALYAEGQPDLDDEPVYVKEAWEESAKSAEPTPAPVPSEPEPSKPDASKSDANKSEASKPEK